MRPRRPLLARSTQITALLDALEWLAPGAVGGTRLLVVSEQITTLLDPSAVLAALGHPSRNEGPRLPVVSAQIAVGARVTRLDSSVPAVRPSLAAASLLHGVPTSC